MDFSDTMSLRGVAALYPCAVYDLRTQDTGGMHESLRLTKPAPLRVRSPSIAQRLSAAHPGRTSFGRVAVGGSWTSRSSVGTLAHEDAVDSRARVGVPL